MAEIEIIVGPKSPIFDSNMFLSKLLTSSSTHQLTHYLLMNNNKLSEEGKLFPYTDEAVKKYQDSKDPKPPPNEP